MMNRGLPKNNLYLIFKNNYSSLINRKNRNNNFLVFHKRNHRFYLIYKHMCFYCLLSTFYIISWSSYDFVRILFLDFFVSMFILERYLIVNITEASLILVYSLLAYHFDHHHSDFTLRLASQWYNPIRKSSSEK